MLATREHRMPERLDREVTRRELLHAATAGFGPLMLAGRAHARADRREFHVWAFGDAHVGTDIRRGRESLAEALRQSESGGAEGGPAFAWDIALNVGDLSGAQGSPD